jgi:hypothetical protein
VTAALDALSAALADIGAPAMVIDGIAVIARGVPRTTLDINATSGPNASISIARSRSFDAAVSSPA